MKDLRVFSGNALKIMAMVTMFIDHLGYILFPKVTILRVIGRLSLPIFAFMIAEGCIYTRSKLRYFLSVFILAVICQFGYIAAGLGGKLSILVTFSYSLLIIFSLQHLRKMLTNGTVRDIVFAYLLSVFAVGATFILTRYYRVDYGFWGCMLPVFAYFAVFVNEKATINFKVATFAVGVAILSYKYKGIQPYSLLALPLILMYSGKRGMADIKYMFYAFYPLHLFILYVIKFLFYK